MLVFIVGFLAPTRNTKQLCFSYPQTVVLISIILSLTIDIRLHDNGLSHFVFTKNGFLRNFFLRSEGSFTRDVAPVNKEVGLVVKASF